MHIPLLPAALQLHLQQEGLGSHMPSRSDRATELGQNRTESAYLIFPLNVLITLLERTWDHQYSDNYKEPHQSFPTRT